MNQKQPTLRLLICLLATMTLAIACSTNDMTFEASEQVVPQEIESEVEAETEPEIKEGDIFNPLGSTITAEGGGSSTRSS